MINQDELWLISKVQLVAKVVRCPACYSSTTVGSLHASHWVKSLKISVTI